MHFARFTGERIGAWKRPVASPASAGEPDRRCRRSRRRSASLLRSRGRRRGSAGIVRHDRLFRRLPSRGSRPCPFPRRSKSRSADARRRYAAFVDRTVRCPRACLASSEPISSARPSAFAALMVAISIVRSAGMTVGSRWRDVLHQGACLHLLDHVHRVIDHRPVGAESDRDTCAMRIGEGGDASASDRFARRRIHQARAHARHVLDVEIGDVDAVDSGSNADRAGRAS